MTLSELKDLADVVQSLMTTTGIAVGGAWALRRYVFNKESLPRLDFSVDVRFVGQQQGQWIVEVLALVENRGLVPHSIKKLRFEIRYLRDEDAPQDGGARIQRQVEFAHVLKSASWTPGDGKGRMLALPGVKLRYNHIAQLPSDAAFVLLHGRLEYDLAGVSDLRADKLLLVPSESCAQALKDGATSPSTSSTASAPSS